MFKVSFKENPHFPVKNVQRFNDGRVTVVTLKGVVVLPVFLQYFIPPKIFDWVDSLKSIDIEFTMSKMYIKVQGKSICSKEDKVDNILGERIAEARAKIYLYKFMKGLCTKLHEYFIQQLYGTLFLTVKISDDPNIIINDNLNKAVNKYWKLYKREIKHLEKLLYHESDTKGSQEH